MTLSPVSMPVQPSSRSVALKDGFRKRSCAKDSSSPSSKDENASDTSGNPMHPIWRFLPEDILHMILSRLPYAAQSRLQCECKNWKEVLARSPPPASMIFKNLGNWNAKFYCDFERRWYSLPSNIRPLPPDNKTTWEVVDVDAGLICYKCHKKGLLWLWVCNPLQPSWCRLIEPAECYRPAYPRQCHHQEGPGPSPLQLKLVVNRETKNFKIVHTPFFQPNYYLPKTEIYDSRESSWHDHVIDRLLSTKSEYFVWKDVLYAYDVQKERRHQRSTVAALNWETKKWENFEPKLPSEFQFPTHHYFLSDNEQVMVVLFSYRKRPRPYFSVWKLLSEDLNSIGAPAGDLRWEKWQKIDLRSVTDTVNLKGYQLTGACLGSGYICFTFSDDKAKAGGFESQKCVRYSFGAKTWNLVQSPEAEGWRKALGHSLHNWEPCLDIDPRCKAPLPPLCSQFASTCTEGC